MDHPATLQHVSFSLQRPSQGSVRHTLLLSQKQRHPFANSPSWKGFEKGFPPPTQRRTCQSAQPWSKSLSHTCAIKDLSSPSIESTYNEFGHKLAWPKPSVSSTTHLRGRMIGVCYVVLGFKHFALVVPLVVTWSCKCFHHCLKCCRSSQLHYDGVGFAGCRLIYQWDWQYFQCLGSLAKSRLSTAQLPFSNVPILDNIHTYLLLTISKITYIASSLFCKQGHRSVTPRTVRQARALPSSSPFFRSNVRSIK